MLKELKAIYRDSNSNIALIIESEVLPGNIVFKINFKEKKMLQIGLKYKDEDSREAGAVIRLM